LIVRFYLAMPAIISRRAVVMPDAAAFLSSFDLSFESLLTTDSAKARKDARQLIAMHYATPARGLARACDPGTVSSIAPRGYLADVAAMADRHGMATAVASHNGCRFATTGCAAGCLAYSGHGGLSVAVQSCRARRTLSRLADPVTYGRAILAAVCRELSRARAAGLSFALRLNGTDEHPWHRLRFPVAAVDAIAIRRRYGVDVETGESLTVVDALASLNNDVRFYEYLKAPVDGIDGLQAWRAAGFDVTASFAADRRNACRAGIAAVGHGFRLALPVAIDRGAPIPSKVLIASGLDRVILSTIDGDSSDARYRDSSADCAVILRAKRSRGADPAASSRFILPASGADLADGSVQFCA
jgi:hypothetical protein